MFTRGKLVLYVGISHWLDNTKCMTYILILIDTQVIKIFLMGYKEETSSLKDFSEVISDLAHDCNFKLLYYNLYDSI